MKRISLIRLNIYNNLYNLEWINQDGIIKKIILEDELYIPNKLLFSFYYYNKNWIYFLSIKEKGKVYNFKIKFLDKWIKNYKF